MNGQIAGNGVGVAVDGGWWRDDIPSFGQQIDPLPFAAAQGLSFWQPVVEMRPAPGLDSVSLREFRMPLGKVGVASGIVKIEHDQPGDTTGDDAQTGVAQLKKPVLQLSLGCFLGLIDAPLQRRMLGAVGLGVEWDQIVTGRQIGGRGGVKV